MEELCFGKLPVGARFYYLSERYVKVTATSASLRCKRAYSKNPMHYGDVIELAETEPVRRVVRTYADFLPEGYVLDSNGYHNGSYYKLTC